MPQEEIGCYEPEAGILFSSACIRTLKRLALSVGAELKVNSPVMDIEIFDDSVKVYTPDDTFEANKLIISGGAWNKKLLNELNININIQPSRQTIAWFDSDDILYKSDGFPGFLRMCLLVFIMDSLQSMVRG